VTSEIRPIVFAGPMFRHRKPAIVVESSSKGLDVGACAAALERATAAAAKGVASATRREWRISRGGGGGTNRDALELL
jgi:hypothetical protein